MEHCEKHGDYEPKEIVILGRVFRTMCPMCEKEQAEAEKRMEQEAKRNAIIESFMRRGIEPEFISATLDNYVAENDSERKALAACRELDAGEIKKVVLLGSNGVGKTHLASALAKKHNGIVITMFKLSDVIRSGYKDGFTDCEVLDNLLQKPFIAIDELGRTKGSDAERNWISYLVDKAHVRGIRLMLISNRQTSKNLPAERKGEAFEYFVDNDVISRLHTSSRVVEINGRDRRN